MSLPDNSEFGMSASHTDDTVLPLTDDQQVASLDAIKCINDAMQFLSEGVHQHKTVVVSTRHNTIGVARSLLTRLNKVLGGEADDVSEVARLQKMLRTTHAENSRLREEMAKGVTDEAVGHRLYALSKIVDGWWKSLGFSYISSGLFLPQATGAAYKVELSAGLDTSIGVLAEDAPVTGKAMKMQTIDELSKVTDIHGVGDNRQFLDTPHNRLYIEYQLLGRFPGASIWSFSSHKHGNYGVPLFRLSRIEAYIPIQSIQLEEKS